MQSSKVSTKYQITIPKGIRQKIGISAGDIIVFDVQKDKVQIEKLEEFYEKYAGSIKVKEPVKAVKEAREGLWE
ncbi:MAG: AbrB/MazE/SpoVT family DNA-binding domain-containing protein [Methanosarcinales archaeon Met12]|nr:MAG: AbrB/MazE/SpoVT family DNA-binding domain-containing protein [Methanosarcinales archaeon Met12]